MGVSKNTGTPKWIVYNGKPIKMDDLGVPLFLETPIYIYTYLWILWYCMTNILKFQGPSSPFGLHDAYIFDLRWDGPTDHILNIYGAAIYSDLSRGHPKWWFSKWP